MACTPCDEVHATGCLLCPYGLDRIRANDAAGRARPRWPPPGCARPCGENSRVPQRPKSTPARTAHPARVIDRRPRCPSWPDRFGPEAITFGRSAFSYPQNGPYRIGWRAPIATERPKRPRTHRATMLPSCRLRSACVRGWPFGPTRFWQMASRAHAPVLPGE